jgi:hypothetical protein
MQNNLREWEEYLKPYFEQIQVLGEIPLNRYDVEQIGLLIRTHIQKKGLTRATRDFQTTFPRTFITYLALSAAFNTEVGYWGGIIEIVGVASTNALFMSNHHWGKIFIEITRKLSLRDFSNIGAPDPYVTAIRMHGGIPTYSLPDFFEHILLPSIRKPEFAELPTRELVKTVLESNTIHFYVDSPVIYYLENGRSAAIEFVENCRRMARSYEQTQEMPETEEIGLPIYVVQTFQQYMEDKLEFAHGRQIRSWRLYLDAFGPDFYVSLPPQIVEGVQASGDYYWCIEMFASRNQKIVNKELVKIRRRGVHLETDERQIPLEHLAEHLDVHFIREEYAENDQGRTSRVIRSWHKQIKPLPNHPPLVVFRYNDQQFCNWNQSLPGDTLWLIYPSKADLSVDGEAHMLESGVEMTEPWVDWQLKAWDLNRAYAVHLTIDGKEICTPIPIQSRTPEPLLVGNNFIAQNADPDKVPIYIGAPPALQIPVRPGRSGAQEAHHWQVAIESRWAAVPISTGERYAVDKFADHLICKEQTMELPLDKLLGENPCGTYQIDAVGPLGMRSAFRFRVWPDMELEGLQPYYLPTLGKAQPAHFTLRLNKNCIAQPQAGSEGVIIEKVDHHFEIAVAPDKTIADLYLIYPAVPEPVRLPLSLSIPRLSWALPQGIDDVEIEWNTLPIKSSLDALLQSSHTTLYLSLPLVTEIPLTLTLHLIDPETQRVIQVSQTQEARPKQTRWRFALGEFFDTLRSLEEQPVFEFCLELLDFKNNHQWLVPLLQVSRTLDIQDVNIEFLDTHAFRLYWNEQKPLRNRRVRIWSEWQPWIPPIELTIPDEARGELLVSDVELPPSYYRIYFFTAAPWENKNPPPLPPKLSHIVKSTTPSEVLTWIDDRLKSKPDYFLLHFFKACVLEAKGDSHGLNDEIQWCCQNLQRTTPQTIIAFHRWVGGFNPNDGKPRDVNTQKAVRIYMFRPDNLGRLLETHPEMDKVRVDYLEEYLNTSLVMPASAIMMLEHDHDPQRGMRSLEILVKRQYPEALSRIIKRIENGQLSDSDAVDLLALNLDHTIPALANINECPIKSRLIKRVVEISPDQQFFIMTSHWIRTVAGWGQIDSIQDRDGNELSYFCRDIDKPNLSVTLHPINSPEKIEISLSEGTLRFQNIDKVYQCTKDECYGFISADQNLVINEHNRAAHIGIGPAFRPVSIDIQFHQQVFYSLKPPVNQFE